MNSFLLFLLLSAFCYCGDFFTIFCKNTMLGFQGFIVKKDDFMESLTLPKRQQITFDRSDEISGASEQSFWNSRFYRVCRVKVNEALKPEYLLKRLKMKKKKMFMFTGVSRTAATSKMQHFVIIVNSWRLLSIITKSSELDVAAGLNLLWCC